MEQKIIERITELTNQINDLLSRREDLFKELKSIEKDVDVMVGAIHELRSLLPSDIKE